jgi:hypothetical protein
MLLPLVLTTVTFLGADPKASEDLPAPRAVPAAEQPIFAPSFYRRSHYAVWQVTSPDLQGVWKPRVDFIPGRGFYYMYNGHPFYWDVTHQIEYNPPGIAGTPYRSYGPRLYILPAVIEVKPAPKSED